jgi:hypothetical protein
MYICTLFFSYFITLGFPVLPADAISSFPLTFHETKTRPVSAWFSTIIIYIGGWRIKPAKRYELNEWL